MRELVVLGTASRTPTRNRSHHAALLRWDDQGILFDPGEGAQRQLTLAGVSPSTITAICITHFHGDHCLGLPGVAQRLSADRVDHPIDVYFPASGTPYFDRLMTASISAPTADIRAHPSQPGMVVDGPPLSLEARGLEHRVEALGWRLAEPDGRRMLPDRLAALGIRGADIGRLQRQGQLEVDGQTVALDEVSAPKPGQKVAFVMDTALCDAAYELAAGVDLLVCEATFLSEDEDLARRYGHLTAAQAGQLAAAAGARRLVLTHYSQRYGDEELFAQEARAYHGDVVAGRDLMRVPVPPRADVWTDGDVMGSSGASRPAG